MFKCRDWIFFLEFPQLFHFSLYRYLIAKCNFCDVSSYKSNFMWFVLLLFYWFEWFIFYTFDVYFVTGDCQLILPFDDIGILVFKSYMKEFMIAVKTVKFLPRCDSGSPVEFWNEYVCTERSSCFLDSIFQCLSASHVYQCFECCSNNRMFIICIAHISDVRSNRNLSC